jgi:hypothetical protein
MDRDYSHCKVQIEFLRSFLYISSSAVFTRKYESESRLTNSCYMTLPIDMCRPDA